MTIVSLKLLVKKISRRQKKQVRIERRPQRHLICNKIIILESIVVDVFSDQIADVWVHIILDRKLCGEKLVKEQSVV